MSFWSRHFRQSTYCLAPGNFFTPKARCFSFTSHKATTFALARPPKWASPRPHVPRRATFSLLLGAFAPKSRVLGRMSPAAPVKAIDLRKWRRFMGRVWPRSSASSSSSRIRAALSLLQFIRQPCDQRIESRQCLPGLLVAHILRELERRRRIEVLYHHAVSAVRHNSEQLTGPAEHQVTARRIELAEQALEGIAVHLDVERSRQVNLEFAFPVIALLRADQHRILELVGVRRGAVNLAAKLPGFRLRDRYKDHARVQLV